MDLSNRHPVAPFAMSMERTSPAAAATEQPLDSVPGASQALSRPQCYKFTVILSRAYLIRAIIWYHLGKQIDTNMQSLLLRVDRARHTL
jgi:hypothetical protein